MDRLAWFPCYASKLLGALPKLSPDERFVYLIALLRIYERNGPCPDEAEHFSRFTGLTVNRCAKALELLFKTGKLVMGPEGFTNPVADETLADMKAMHERQKLAGKYAANIRWDKRNRKSEENQGNVDATRMRSDAHLHLQEHKQRKKVSKTPQTPQGGAVSDWPSDFKEIFWAKYPRKEGKQSALGKLEVVRKGGVIPWARFLAGLERYVAHTAAIEQRYIKQPTTWLNGGCWDDEFKSNGGSAHERPGEVGTNNVAGRAPPRTDAVFTGMVRALAERRARRAADNAGRPDVRGGTDVTGGDDAGRASPGDDGRSCGEFAFSSQADPGERR
jgi:hypothetical protein